VALGHCDQFLCLAWSAMNAGIHVKFPNFIAA
jgi:hypothetical protein